MNNNTEIRCVPIKAADGTVIGNVTIGPRLGEPVPTLSKWPRWNCRVWVSCCSRWERPKNTTVKSGFQDWYGWTHVFECARGKGCRKNPRLKCGAYLRDICHHG